MDIVLYRGNSNKVAMRALLPLINLGGRLISIDGGSLRNAIPREAFAEIAIPEAKIDQAKKIVEGICKDVKAELSAVDPDANITLEKGAKGNTVIDAATALNLVKSVYACPNGVIRMSDAMPGLVETSSNLAIVHSENGVAQVKCLMRGSVDSGKDDLGVAITSVFELAGAKVELAGGYPGWKPNMDSAILKAMKEVYNNMYGVEPKVMAIHAGLECGILGGTYPNWDMISCGPTIRSPHSPDERVCIPTVEKWWNYVVEVLKNAPVKK